MSRSVRSAILHEQKKAMNEIRKQLARRRLRLLKPFWYKIFRPYSFLVVDPSTGGRLVLPGHSALDDAITLRLWVDGLQAHEPNGKR